jgi:hypothetical protein
MAVRIVDHPKRPRLRLGRRMAVLFGVVFVIAGLIAAIFPLLFVLAIVSSPALGDDVTVTDEDVAGLLITTGYAVVGLIVGPRLIRGRRRMVLFLRRFRHDEATAMITAAVETAVGNSWRVVTLDDESVAPVGVVKFGRRLARSGMFVGLGVVGLVAWWWATGGVGQLLDDLFDGIAAEAEGADVIGAVIAAAVIGVIVLVLILAATTFFGGLTLLSVASLRARRRSERAKRAEIGTRSDIGQVVDGIARSTKRIFAPRLVVVRVANPVWQEVVLDLADRAHMVVVDVSEPTDHLAWEVETLHGPSYPARILIAHRPDLLALTGGQASGDPSVLRLLAAIDGSEVIAYETDNRSIRRFVRALAGALTSG